MKVPVLNGVGVGNSWNWGRGNDYGLSGDSFLKYHQWLWLAEDEKRGR